MRRLVAATTAVTLTFALVACGDDGSSERDEALDALQQLEDELGDLSIPDLEDLEDLDLPDMDDLPDADGEPVPIDPPVFMLTGPVDEPDGFVLDPAQCAATDEGGPPYFTYYIPDTWTTSGTGSSGSGGPVGGRGTHTYELPDGPTVDLEIAEDNNWVDGEATDADGNPWETWDYDTESFSSDGTEDFHRVTYDELDPIEIDGETFDLWYLDQDQDELVSRSEYKLRIVFAEVPTGGFGLNARRPASTTVVVSWNAENGDLDEDELRTILGTFRVDECAQTETYDYYELITGSDWG